MMITIAAQNFFEERYITIYSHNIQQIFLAIIKILCYNTIMK